jgi:hypothetical protein
MGAPKNSGKFKRSGDSASALGVAKPRYSCNNGATQCNNGAAQCNNVATQCNNGATQYTTLHHGTLRCAAWSSASKRGATQRQLFTCLSKDAAAQTRPRFDDAHSRALPVSEVPHGRGKDSSR